MYIHVLYPLFYIYPIYYIVFYIVYILYIILVPHEEVPGLNPGRGKQLKIFQGIL